MGWRLGNENYGDKANAFKGPWPESGNSRRDTLIFAIGYYVLSVFDHTMGWLLKNIGTNDLLRAEQEVLLARQVQAMIAFQSVRGDLAAQLGCIPTNSE